MKKDQLEAILTMAQEDEKREEIIAKIKAAIEAAETNAQGWGISVCMDPDGKVWETDIMSDSSCSASQWNGETYTVAYCKAWNVGDYDFDFEDGIRCLPERKEIKAAFDADDDYDGDFEDFVREKYPEAAKKVDVANIDWIRDEDIPEHAANEYDAFVERLEDDIREQDFCEK